MASAHRRGLTARQTEVLLFVQRYYTQHGYAPTIREISASLGLTRASGTVGGPEGALAALQRRSWLRLEPSINRGIILSVLGYATVQGRGYPIFPLTV